MPSTKMEITKSQKEKLIIEAKKALKNVFPKDWPSSYSAAVLTKKRYPKRQRIEKMTIKLICVGKIKHTQK